MDFSGKIANQVVGEIEQVGKRALLVRGDVADKMQVQRMVDEIYSAFGRIDILVNNAGSLIMRIPVNPAIQSSP
ncbi:MAG: SDR family NAD(P)-dependent oxidoreductase [Bacilli bacterium]